STRVLFLQRFGYRLGQLFGVELLVDGDERAIRGAFNLVLMAFERECYFEDCLAALGLFGGASQLGIGELCFDRIHYRLWYLVERYLFLVRADAICNAEQSDCC